MTTTRATEGHATLMHHTLITLAALALAEQVAAWRAALAIDPYMWVAIPAVYAACGHAIRKTFELG